MSWYLKGFPAGGDLRRDLALVSTLEEMDALLARLDPDATFPVVELGTPRAVRAAPARASPCPRAGWTTRTAPAASSARTPRRPPAAEARRGRAALVNAFTWRASRTGCDALGWVDPPGPWLGRRSLFAPDVRNPVPRGNPRGRHSLAHRPTRARRLALVAAPVATALAVGVGVLTSGFTAPEDTGSASGNLSAAARPAHEAATTPASDAADRTLGTSRSVERVPLVDNRVPKAKGRLWTTADLDLRVEPREKSGNVGLVKSGKQVSVTGKRLGDYSEVIVGRATRWVTSRLPEQEQDPRGDGPQRPALPGRVRHRERDPAGRGEGLPRRVRRLPRADHVRRSGRPRRARQRRGHRLHGPELLGGPARWPTSSTRTTPQLDLFDIIWSQHIWTIQRAGEGFRSMSDRGSATANHYDHVHIKIN